MVEMRLDYNKADVGSHDGTVTTMDTSDVSLSGADRKHAE